MNPDSLNKLAYFGNEEDGYSRYVLFLEDRPVLWAFANKDEDGMPIFVSKAEEGAPRLKTKGNAFIDVERGHVDGTSMQAHIYTRLPWILADLYVPQDGK